MNENEINTGTQGTVPQVDASVTENTQGTGGDKPERTFTKSQVNDIMKRRIERSHNAFFTRYGVKDLSELDNLVGQARSYGPLKERFDELDKSHNETVNSYKDLTKKYAYRVGNIDESRISDIEAYFKGKNIEIDEKSLAEELKTHPEWVRKVGTVKSIGAEATPNLEVDERALASKYFGVNLTKKR